MLDIQLENDKKFDNLQQAIERIEDKMKEPAQLRPISNDESTANTKEEGDNMSVDM